MTPVVISTSILALACLITLFALVGVNMLIAIPMSILLVLAGIWAHRKRRKSVENKLFKSLNQIAAIKGIKPSARRDGIYWPQREILSVIVDNSNEKIHFIDYKHHAGIKSYYSYSMEELGCVAVYVSFDAKNRSEAELAEEKKRKRKSLAIEIRTRNPGQPGGMRDIQLYPIERMRLFKVPFARFDDDMFVFATQGAALAMDAITGYYSKALNEPQASTNHSPSSSNK